MWHVLFKFAGLPIYSYWFFYGLGLFSAILLVIWLAHHRSMDWRKACLLSVAALISAVVFARLSSVFFDTRFSDLLDFQKRGQISFGGSFGALFAIILLARPLKISIGDAFGCAACAIPLAQGIQRIGCFLNGCCFGPVSNSIFSVCFPRGTSCFMYHVKTGLSGSSDLYSQAVFPIQLAALLGCLVISLICIWLFLRKKLEGQILGVYFVLYGAFRFILQWYRPDYDRNNIVSGWNTGHSICLLMFLTGLVILLSRNYAMKCLLPQKIPSGWMPKLPANFTNVKLS